MKARLSDYSYVGYFDAAGAGPWAAPIAKIYTDAGVLVTTLALSPSTVEPAQYISALYTFATVGNYQVTYEDGLGGVLGSEDIEVGIDPTPDYEIGQARNIRIAITDIGDASSTVSVKIINTSGTLEQSLVTTVDAVLGVYKTSATYTFSTAGTYFLVWIDDGVATVSERILALTPRGRESVDFYFGSVIGDTTTAQIDVTVIISDEDELPIDYAVTDSTGAVAFSLYPGDYVVSLIRDDDVFTSNNFEITVTDLELSPAYVNSFPIVVEHFTPTIPTYTTPSLCVLSSRFLDMEGMPLTHAEVLVAMKGGPIVNNGAVTFGHSKVYTTNANGYVEMSLLRGITVEIGIMSTGLRRIVTVPAQATADLMDLLATAEDVFDIVVPTIADAIRRSP